jgi:hypothetical protein
MKSQLVWCLSAAVLVCLAQVGFGSQIVQTKPYSGTPDFNQVLTFNQFDNSLGTLTSIDVSADLSTSGGALKLDNDAVTAASGSVSFGARLLLSGSVPLIDSGFNQIFPTGSVDATGSASTGLSADDGDSEVGGTANFSYIGADYGSYAPGSLSASHSGNVNTAVFGSYTGTGTYTITADASQVASYGSLGGVQAQIDPLSAGGNVTVTYNYNPTPEPANLLLLAVALAPMGIIVWRRRQ